VNLQRRFSRTVFISRPVAAQGNLGGVGEGYAAPHLSIRGRLVPRDDLISARRAGLTQAQHLKLILPRHADLLPGDGVRIAGSSEGYRCISCERYPLHLCAVIERRLE